MPPWTTLVTVALIVEYWAFSGLVAVARRETGIKAPQMTGHPKLDRVQRIHLNTLEKLAMILPTLWIAALTVDDRTAAACGLGWLVSRVIFAAGYWRDAKSRTAGSLLGDVFEVALVGLAAYGAVQGVLAA